MKITPNNYSSMPKKLRIWSHLLKKSLMENFILCAVTVFLAGAQLDSDFVRLVIVLQCLFTSPVLFNIRPSTLVSGNQPDEKCRMCMRIYIFCLKKKTHTHTHTNKKKNPLANLFVRIYIFSHTNNKI